MQNPYSLASVGVVNKSTWPSFTIYDYDCLFNRRVSTYLNLNQVNWIYQLFKLDVCVG